MDYVIELMKREPECYGNAYQDGKKDGLNEGEKNKSIAIVKNMLKENIDIDVISKVTDMSIEQINTFK